jgi:hypothetical protein
MISHRLRPQCRGRGGLRAARPRPSRCTQLRSIPRGRRRILELAEQLPRIWHDPRVDTRERKRILRLLVEDVTPIKAGTITAHVRLSRGAKRTLVLDNKFKPELVAQVDRLLERHCDREIATILKPGRLAQLGGEGVQPEEYRLYP